MLALYLLQTLVPLALIVWIAVAPPRSSLGFWTQAIATGVGVVAVGYTGVWLFPPWWAPYGFAVLLLASIPFALTRSSPVSRWPTELRGWIVAVGFGALGVFAANATRVAVAESQPPQVGSIALSWPLEAGRYYVANGGIGVSVNAHADALDQSIPAHRTWRGTAYGIDLVAIDGWGLRAEGVMPREPDQYRIFGVQVVAPCAGDIVVAQDGLPDMQVPDLDEQHPAGNHVILRCEGVDIVLGHFRRGSVRVRLGEALAVGAAIAEVGNSGASTEPHLHIHAQMHGTEAAPFSGAPIPIVFNRRFLVRSDRPSTKRGG